MLDSALDFDPDPFGQRLTRARNNCYETLPAFVALAVGAVLPSRRSDQHWL
jgi:uncharacterized MAPEG superfamily protein